MTDNRVTDNRGSTVPCMPMLVCKIAETSIKNPNQLIEEEDVEVHPEKLPDAIFDENVDVHLIRKFFSQDAWLLVTEVVKQKQDKPLYICLYCLHDLGEAPSMVCDH